MILEFLDRGVGSGFSEQISNHGVRGDEFNVNFFVFELVAETFDLDIEVLGL